MPPTEYRFDDLDLRVEPDRPDTLLEKYPTTKCPTTSLCTNTDLCTESPCTTSC